jgi:hypothetical protein
MAHQQIPLVCGGQEVLLLQAYFAAYPNPDSGLHESLDKVVQLSVLGLVPLALPAALPDELRNLWTAVRRVTAFGVSDNLVYSLIADASKDQAVCWETWAPYLADLFKCDRVAINPARFATLLRAADGLLRTWDRQRFVSVLEGAEESQQETKDMTSLAVIAIAGVATVAAGALLAKQLVAPSAEFMAIRKLAPGHHWARELLRRGPCLAERTGWTLKQAWNPSLFRSPKEREEACRLIADVADSFSLIEPRPGSAFASDVMKTADIISVGWVRDVVEAGLRCGSQVIHPASVRLTTADEIALQKTNHRLSTAYMALSPCVEVLRTEGFVPDCLKAAEDIARSPAEVDEWIRSIVKNSPSDDLELLIPQVGERINEKEMILREEVLLPAKAVVTRVLRPGLKKRGECLFRAEVVASDN